MRKRRQYGEVPELTDPYIAWEIPGVGKIRAGLGETGTVEVSIKQLDELIRRCGGRRIEVAGLRIDAEA